MQQANEDAQKWCDAKKKKPKAQAYTVVIGHHKIAADNQNNRATTIPKLHCNTQNSHSLIMLIASLQKEIH